MADEPRDDGGKASDLTLRDWFAGKALSGLLARGDFTYERNAAESAYVYADAMLAERKTKR